MASSKREAFRLIDSSPPARALLEVNVSSETRSAVARKLFGHGIACIFAIGCRDGFRIPVDPADTTAVERPYHAEDPLRAFPA